mgnify:CR=1 FL=1|tara:strand:- start:427 stop:1032 length:606 start_codon:yes stop_codon:yes gene_type:complete
MFKIIIMGSSDEQREPTHQSNTIQHESTPTPMINQNNLGDQQGVEQLLSNINPNDPNFQNMLQLIASQTHETSRKKHKQKKQRQPVQLSDTDSDSDSEMSQRKNKQNLISNNTNTCCDIPECEEDDDDDQSYEGESDHENESDSSEFDPSFIVEQLTETLEQLFRDSNGNTLADIMSSQYSELTQINQNLKKLTKVMAANR